jgi:hypothetical protein
VLGTFNGLSELPSFSAHAAPALRDSDRGLSLEINDLVERSPRIGLLGRVYGWGPKTGEWDTLGHCQVKWLSPFAGWPDVRTTLPALPPPMIVDLTRSISTYYSTYSRTSFTFAPGDDPAHALLVGRGSARPDGILFELEADRAPIEVRRADGEPFGDIEGVVRAAGRWFVATPAVGTASQTIVWEIEGGVARELARVPRALPDNQLGSRTKLARRSDGRAIGLVVDGQATAERGTAVRWVLPITLDNGAIAEPEPLGYVDLAGRSLDACGDDTVGWELDTSISALSSVRVRLPQGSGVLNTMLARLRLTTAHACVEALAGNFDAASTEKVSLLARSSTAPVRNFSPRPGEVAVTAMSALQRYPLRCSIVK